MSRRVTIEVDIEDLDVEALASSIGKALPGGTSYNLLVEDAEAPYRDFYVADRQAPLQSRAADAVGEAPKMLDEARVAAAKGRQPEMDRAERMIDAAVKVATIAASASTVAANAWAAT